MRAPARKTEANATLDDLAAIPEEERRRCELIDGSIVEKGAATGEHGQSQFNLSTYLTPFRRRPGGRWPGGWWFATEVDVYFDPQNTLRPDVVGWRRERVPQYPRGFPVRVRPDWVCKVLSTNKRDAERTEEVLAEPFEAVPLLVGVLFGDDEEPAQES